MSLEQINNELMYVIGEIKFIRSERDLKRELDKIDGYKLEAQNPNNEVLSHRKEFDMELYDAFKKAYETLKARSDQLRDERKMETDIDDVSSVEKMTEASFEDFENNIDDKKLEVIKHLKDIDTDQRIIEVLEKESEEIQSDIEQNDDQIKELADFRKPIGKNDINRGQLLRKALEMFDSLKQERDKLEQVELKVAEINNMIASGLTGADFAIQQQEAIIDEATAELARLNAETPPDPVKISEQNDIITDANNEKSRILANPVSVPDLASLLTEQNSIKRETKVNIRTIGNELNTLSPEIEKAGFPEIDASKIVSIRTLNITDIDNLLTSNKPSIEKESQLCMNRIMYKMKTIYGSNNILKDKATAFLLGVNMDDITSGKNAEEQYGIVLNGFEDVSNTIGRLDRENEELKVRKAGKEKVIEDLDIEMEKTDEEGIDGTFGINNKGRADNSLLSSSDYRKQGVDLDPEYADKDWATRFRERQKYVLNNVMHPNQKFKRTRAFFRTMFSERAGYALSLERANNSKTKVRKEKVFQEMYKVYNAGGVSIDQARDQAIKNIDVKDFSGKTKPQMEER